VVAVTIRGIFLMIICLPVAVAAFASGVWQVGMVFMSGFGLGVALFLAGRWS
jgi:hypothetical protein